MADQGTAAAPKVASLGKTVRSDFNMGGNVSDEVNTGAAGADAGGAAADAGAASGAAAGGEAGAAAAAAAGSEPTFSEDQKKAYFKTLGIDYEGDDKIKEKLNQQQQAASPVETEEQKQEKVKARDKRKLDLFISNGGTVDQFVAIKNFAEADLSVLSMNTLKMDLSENGFSEAQIEEIIQERYFQTPDDVIELLGDDTQKEFAKKKKDFFSKKLNSRSAHIKIQAAEALSTLDKAIDSEDLQQKTEQEISTNIDEKFKTLPRKSTFEIGELNGKAIPPIESEVPESEIVAVRDLLKDPAKRNQFLYNQDGSVNISNIADILAENKILKSAMKVAYHEGGSRQVAEFEKTFPSRSAYDVGVGGSRVAANNTGVKKPASFGKNTKALPATN